MKIILPRYSSQPLNRIAQEVPKAIFGATHVADPLLLTKHLADLDSSRGHISASKMPAFNKLYAYIRDLIAKNENPQAAAAMVWPTWDDIRTLMRFPESEPGVDLKVLLSILDNVSVPGITEANKALMRRWKTEA